MLHLYDNTIRGDIVLQKLQFETSWDRAIAVQDRENIEKIFTHSKKLRHSDYVCTPIRKAMNHKQELLVTVLVHNFTEYPLVFINKSIICKNSEGKVVGEHVFTIPALTIPSNVSMPWTFIFPVGSFKQTSLNKKGCLEIVLCTN